MLSQRPARAFQFQMSQVSCVRFGGSGFLASGNRAKRKKWSPSIGLKGLIPPFKNGIFLGVKTLTVDAQQRVRLPEAKPGQVFSYEPNPNGMIKLIPVVSKQEPRAVVAKLTEKGDDLFMEIPKGYTLDPEAIGQAVREERDSR